MDPLDKARPAAEKALTQVRRGLAQGQSKLLEIGGRRRYDQLLRDLGEAYYAEHRGEGSHEAVSSAVAALDAHRAAAQPKPSQPMSPGPSPWAMPPELASPSTSPGTTPSETEPSEDTPPQTARPD